MPTRTSDDISVHYTDLTKQQGPQFTMRQNRSQGERSIKVDWNKTEEAIKAFVGGSTVVNIPPFGAKQPGAKYLHRRIPHAIPVPTQNQWAGVIDPTFDLNTARIVYMFASAVTKTKGLGPMGNPSATPATFGFDGNTGVPNYKYAQIDLLYESLPYNVLVDDAVKAPLGNNPVLIAGPIVPAQPNQANRNPLAGNPDEGFVFDGATRRIPRSHTRYISRRYEYTSRCQTLPQGVVYCQGLPLPGGFPYIIPGMLLEYTWHNVIGAGVPFIAHQRVVQHVNDNWFDGFPPGTLLCEAPRLKEGSDYFGNEIFDVVYRFSWFPGQNNNGQFLGWNSFFMIDQTNKQNADFFPVSLGAPNLVAAILAAFGVQNPIPVPTNQPFKTANFADLFRPDQV